MNIGVLGGGQLGRMLALAGCPLGLRFRFLDPSPEAPAGDVGELVVGGYEDGAALERFARGLDAATYEFENVPAQAVRKLAERLPVYPPAGALETAQDRLLEKQLFSRLGIPTPAFAAARTAPEVEAALEHVGLPAMIKTRRMGYDGKGQAVVRMPGEVAGALESLRRGAPGGAGGGAGPDLIVEAFVPFERELSILAVRGTAGEEAFYPLVQNEHGDGILRLSRAPAPSVSGELERLARGHAASVVRALGYVGVLAIELFQRGGELLGNEMAPRVHNSGHWTIEGARTSQFENHLRAILGWPLGSAEAVGHSAMVNLIGTAPPAEELLAVRGAHVHLYRKAARAGRKLGHVTVWRDTAHDVDAGLESLRRHLGGAEKTW